MNPPCPCVPDDVGATPTLDGDFVMLWERYGRTIRFSLVRATDPLRFHRDDDGTR